VLQEYLVTFFKDCAARNVGNFAANVDQLSTEEILIVRQIAGQ
jgi:importin-9